LGSGTKIFGSDHANFPNSTKKGTKIIAFSTGPVNPLLEIYGNFRARVVGRCICGFGGVGRLLYPSALHFAHGQPFYVLWLSLVERRKGVVQGSQLTS
jgi:hypothetical protein